MDICCTKDMYQYLKIFRMDIWRLTVNRTGSRGTATRLSSATPGGTGSPPETTAGQYFIFLLPFYFIVSLFFSSPSFSIFKCPHLHFTEEFTRRVRKMSSQLFVTLYTLSIYPSTQRQLRRHLPNPSREFPCI